MAATAGEAPPFPSSDPPEYKTWILKVSIHCQGCKRKVHKILKTIHGVQDIDIDIKQQKVVVTGNVEAHTLIHKLTNAGKHVQLWPSTPPPPPQPQIHDAKTPHETTNKPSPPANDTTDINKSEPQPPAAEPKPPIHAKSGLVDQDKKAPEAGSAEKEPPDHPPKVEKKVGEPEDVGNSGGGEKKKNKGEVLTGAVVNGEVAAAAVPPTPAPASGGDSLNRGGSPPQTSVPPNESIPRHHGNQYPPHYYYTHPPPVPVVSYNTTHPSTAYTSSYYASPPPMYSHAYSYSYSYPYPYPSRPEVETVYPYQSRPEVETVTSMESDTYPRQSLDSFEMFSDENPNGCLVM